MRRAIALVLMAVLWSLPAAAQERVWLQIEARPTLSQAQDRARDYAGELSDVNGFRLRSGWYAIALGPYAPGDAARRLTQLKRDRLVPGDAYVSDGTNFRRQFWPVGANALAAEPVAPQVAPAPGTAPAPVLLAPDETLAEARQSERALDAEQRKLLQEALQWEGFYSAAIDGDFGPGTRTAMRAYQEATGQDPTGVLTTKQRDALVTGYRQQFAALGLATVDDAAAGIRITLPTRMVSFSRYEPPFVHYDSIGDSGVRVLLISQDGDRNTLFGLYDVMQTLEIVPLDGARERGDSSFVLTGQGDALHSYTYAALDDGRIKGFTLVWKPADARLMNRVAETMRASLEPYGDHALDPTLGVPVEEQSVDLLSGLEIRRPEMSRTGFYVDSTGTVLTTAEVLGQCRRITIGDDHDARVAARDDQLGLAVLRPVEGLAPLAFAAFQTGVPRLQSDVALAGFSYGEALDLPVLTYGTVTDLRGLAGETSLSRLALDALPGDAGGPVFDASGAVMGILLPRENGNRQLPEDVNFAASVPAIAEFLSANGVEMAASDRNGQIDPEDLAGLAWDMTVRVSCWN